MKKIIQYSLALTFIGIILTPLNLVKAEDNSLGVKSPDQALRDVFEPLKDAFQQAVEFIQGSIQEAWDLIKIALFWIADLIKPITTFIDGLFEKITGITIGEGFQKIGDFFIYLIDWLANLIKNIISLISFKK